MKTFIVFSRKIDFVICSTALFLDFPVVSHLINSIHWALLYFFFSFKKVQGKSFPIR